MLNLLDLIYLKSFWIITLVSIVYIYLKFVVYNYWNKVKVPHVPPTMLLGNMDLDFIRNKITIGELVRKHYEKFRKERFFGMYIFHNPIFLVNDPELIRLIMVKDFQHFADRGIHSNLKVDPMTFNLFRLPGEKWRHLRTKLSPIFTSGKLKQLYPLLVEVSNVLVQHCDESLKHSDILDLKDIIERFITDCISNVAFGFNCNSLQNPNNEFRKYGIAGTDMGKYTAVLSIFCSNILDFLHLSVWNNEVNKFFINIFEDVVKYRVKEKVIRKDFINMLMDLTDYGQENDDGTLNKDSNMDKLSMLEAAAQVFVFFIAGFETTSTTVTYCLHELAKYPEIQDKLQEEIDEIAKTPEGFNYENVMNMPYLDMVFNEASRKHPAVPFLNRLCTKDYPIPNSDIVIPKGMRVAIPISGLQNDPEIFPNAHKFDPEHFSKENCVKRNPYYFLPFGEGPRICIAKRIALMQGKLGLVTLLSKYKFEICKETPVPLRYSNRSFLLVTEHELLLKVSRR